MRLPADSFCEKHSFIIHPLAKLRSGHGHGMLHGEARMVLAEDRLCMRGRHRVSWASQLARTLQEAAKQIDGHFGNQMRAVLCELQVSTGHTRKRGDLLRHDGTGLLRLGMNLDCSSGEVLTGLVALQIAARRAHTEAGLLDRRMRLLLDGRFRGRLLLVGVLVRCSRRSSSGSGRWRISGDRSRYGGICGGPSGRVREHLTKVFSEAGHILLKVWSSGAREAIKRMILCTTKFASRNQQGARMAQSNVNYAT